MRDQLLLLGGTEISVDVSEFEALADEAMKVGVRDRIEAALEIYQANCCRRTSTKTGPRCGQSN